MTTKVPTEMTDGFPFTKSYESAEQAITPAGLLTLAHGLGAVPVLVQAWLTVDTAEFGFSVGDTFPINMSQNSADSSQSRGINILVDATDITVKIGSDGIEVIDPGGTRRNITLGNYRLIIRAWR